MNAQTHDAYLAIIDAAEARVAALEAAARAVVDNWVIDGLCYACRGSRAEHEDGCLIGTLATLLDGDA